jgi:hypothetical protein
LIKNQKAWYSKKSLSLKMSLLRELATKADIDIQKESILKTLQEELEAKIEISHKELEAKIDKEGNSKDR